MENVLRPVTVIGGALVATLIAGWLLDLLLRRADARHTETPLWGLLRRCRLPFQVVLCASLLRASYRWAGILPDHAFGIGRFLTLALIASAAWLAVRIATAVVDSTYARYAAATEDEARVRRVRTQVTLIHRVVTAVLVVVAAAAMLLTFPPMRALGASLLASAGVLGIVAGIAAQASLSNLFAGLQIAFGDTVRIGDTVVVDEEWGRVEEITLTFLTVRTWDERRITMPVSYFTSKPYENWSRGGAQMTGTVFWHLDHGAPIDLMRERLQHVLTEIPEWDGRGGGLAVTDTTPHTVQVRAVVTAKDADDLWTLRCAVRERLITWLVAEHPYALPHIATTPAAEGPRGT
ncbi:mechanosensitive ion channel family protein [Streptomyces sp. NPDC001552]|uniref:mechanosensitive ion channel family protein n=1 Tax=Streptomyces sp. NPDC001552 TaxID=3364587 RepID=UPI0036CBAEF3